MSSQNFLPLNLIKMGVVGLQCSIFRQKFSDREKSFGQPKIKQVSYPPSGLNSWIGSILIPGFRG